MLFIGLLWVDETLVSGGLVSESTIADPCFSTYSTSVGAEATELCINTGYELRLDCYIVSL